MPRRDGFSQAQFDSNFAADPKHQRLTRSLAAIGGEHADLYVMAARGLWATAIAYAWASNDPDVTEVVEGENETVVGALLKVGLLEREGDSIVIPRASFDKWIDSARRARDGARDRSERARASRRSSENSGELQRSSPAYAVGVGVGVVDAPSSETSSPPRAHDGRAREEVSDGQRRSARVSEWTPDAQHREGLPNIDADVARALERVTGMSVVQGGRWLTKIDQFVERNGKDATLAAIERIPGRVSYRSLAFALEGAEAVPKIEIASIRPRKTVTDADLRAIDDVVKTYGLGRVAASATLVAAAVSPDDRDRFRDAVVRDLIRRGVRPLSETGVDDGQVRATG